METWHQTGDGEDVPIESVVGLRVLEADELAVYLAAEPFDGFVFAVDSEPYYNTSTLSAMRYPARLRNA